MSKLEDIQFCIDEMIRPAIQGHAGDIELISFEDGIVTVKLTGTCVGCPSKQFTLKAGIERLLTEEFAGIVNEVQLLEDKETVVESIVTTAKELGLYNGEQEQ